MTTEYPRLPLLIAYLVDFVRRSYGLGPNPTVGFCEAFHTIFWGVFPVPSALAARLLRFVFGHGRGEAILRALDGKKAKRIGQALFYFLVAVLLVIGIWGTYLYILKYGWWEFLVLILMVIGSLVFLVTMTIGCAWLADYLEDRRARKADIPAESSRVSLGREVFSTVAVMWHFIVAIKRRLCPIWANPLYRGVED